MVEGLAADALVHEAVSFGAGVCGAREESLGARAAFAFFEGAEVVEWREVGDWRFVAQERSLRERR